MDGREAPPKSGGFTKGITNDAENKAHRTAMTENSANDEDCPFPESKKARLSDAFLDTGGDNDKDGTDSQPLDSASKGSATSLPGATKDSREHSIRRNETLSTTRWLLIQDGDCDGDGDDCWVARIPPSLFSKEQKAIGQDLDRLRALLDRHGLRTSRISSPREAVSIYKDSCSDDGNDPADGSLKDGREFLLIAFGLHPQQRDLEKYYKTCIKNAYCLLLFCKRLRQEYDALSKPKTQSLSGSSNMTNDCRTADSPGNEKLQTLILEIETTTGRLFGETLTFTESTTKKDRCRGVSSRSAQEQATALIELASATKGNRRYRAEEWKKEYQRICVSNSTISNAYLVLLQSTHKLCIKDILFKYNPKEPKYERITIYLYDPSIDYRKPNVFLFIPGLHTILTGGPHELVSAMIKSFWSHVLRNGYFPTNTIQKVLESRLRSFFESGLITATARGNNNNNGYLSLPLKSCFVPSSPLSIYLHGKPGAGKSSLAKVVPMALQSTLEEHLDPECIARFVKQNLNKPLETLELEFQLRPNNNDMSVMSIIQGRRMSMSQSKPGIVVLNLEEMPMHSSEGTNPNQEAVAQLISQRFGGRKGNYQQEQNNNGDNRNGIVGSGGRINLAPRNSDKRSIGRDNSLVTIFTSNYPIAETSKRALEHLELYQSLTSIEMTSITGSDREQFAKSFLRQCLVDKLEEDWSAGISTQKIFLDIESISSNGDTRPLVRQLKMFSYYLGKLLVNDPFLQAGRVAVEEIRVSQSNSDCTLTVRTNIEGKSSQERHQQLIMGSLANWYPLHPSTRNSKVKIVTDKVQAILGNEKATELAVILEFWISMTLAPVVILSTKKKTIEHLMDAIELMGHGVNCIRSVNAKTYKMIRSLYDPKEMPNLRDDILKLGRGTLVATELNCPTQTSQLCIREMIEDSPSMTAFSSAKSALYKSGLLFAIYVKGDITPEVLSRVSFVI